jgi:lysophospholipase L1-like esterase
MEILNTSTISFPYIINPYGSNGVKKMRRSLGRVRSSLDGTTAGGMDVVCVGDSRTWGVKIPAGNDSALISSWVHLLKVRAQRELNRPGVTGGFGTMLWNVSPISGGLVATDTAKGMNVTASATATSVGIAGSSAGLGLRHLETATAGLGHILNSNDDATGYTAEFKLGMTNFQIIGETGFGSAGVITPLLQEDGGANSTTLATWDQSVGGVSYGARSSMYNFSSYAGGGATFGATDYRIRIDCTSGTIRFQGIIGYNGDTAEGIRFHNIGASGSRLNNLTGNTNAMLAIDKFGANTGTGACYAGLVMLNVGGYNDLQFPRTAAQFKADMITLVTRWLAWSSAPGIVLILDPRPPMDGNPFTSATHLPLYLGYKQAFREVCASYDVTGVDLDDFCDQSATTAVACGLVNTTDDLHHTVAGHTLQSEILYQVLFGS